jgi:hypothetical protein
MFLGDSVPIFLYVDGRAGAPLRKANVPDPSVPTVLWARRPRPSRQPTTLSVPGAKGDVRVPEYSAGSPLKTLLRQTLFFRLQRNKVCSRLVSR